MPACEPACYKIKHVSKHSTEKAPWNSTWHLQCVSSHVTVDGNQQASRQAARGTGEALIHLRKERSAQDIWADLESEEMSAASSEDNVCGGHRSLVDIQNMPILWVLTLFGIYYKSSFQVQTSRRVPFEICKKTPFQKFMGLGGGGWSHFSA